jgi:cytochrome b involved in lipid metabolism
MNNNHDIEKTLSETSFRTLSNEEQSRVWSAVVRTRTLPPKSMYTMLKPILTALVLAVALGGTVALADNSVPGDPLFGLERAVENARISLASGQKKDDLRIAFANERVKEVERISPKAQSTTTTQTTLSADDKTRVSVGVNDAIILLNGVSTSDPRLKAITDQLNAYLSTLPKDSTVGVRINTEGEKSRIDVRSVDGRIRIEMKDDEVKIKTGDNSTESNYRSKKDSDDDDGDRYDSRGKDDDDDEDEDRDDDDKPRTTPPVVITPPSGTMTSYALAEVATHNTSASCWTVVSGSVYNVTSWIAQHPGGSSAIKAMCGVDATAAFTGQHGGQSRPVSELAGFKIGVLK